MVATSEKEVKRFERKTQRAKGEEGGGTSFIGERKRERIGRGNRYIHYASTHDVQTSRSAMSAESRIASRLVFSPLSSYSFCSFDASFLCLGSYTTYRISRVPHPQASVSTGSLLRSRLSDARLVDLVDCFFDFFILPSSFLFLSRDFIIV